MGLYRVGIVGRKSWSGGRSRVAAGLPFLHASLVCGAAAQVAAVFRLAFRTTRQQAVDLRVPSGAHAHQYHLAARVAKPGASAVWRGRMAMADAGEVKARGGTAVAAVAPALIGGDFGLDRRRMDAAPVKDLLNGARRWHECLGIRQRDVNRCHKTLVGELPHVQVVKGLDTVQLWYAARAPVSKKPGRSGQLTLSQTHQRTTQYWPRPHPTRCASSHRAKLLSDGLEVDRLGHRFQKDERRGPS